MGMGEFIVWSYVILGNNKDTQELVDHLRVKDNGTITIVDEDLESALRRDKENDLTYVNGTYVDSVKDMDLPFVFYHHVKPMHRKDGRKWKRGTLV